MSILERSDPGTCAACQGQGGCAACDDGGAFLDAMPLCPSVNAEWVQCPICEGTAQCPMCGREGRA